MRIGTVTPETRLKRNCKQLMDTFGIFNYQITQGIGSHPGLPDRVAHYKSSVHYLEFKSGNNQLGKNQVKFKEQCEIDGVSYHVIRSIDDIIRIFNLKVMQK